MKKYEQHEPHLKNQVFLQLFLMVNTGVPAAVSNGKHRWTAAVSNKTYLYNIQICIQVILIFAY